MSNLGLEDYLKNKLNVKLIRTDVGDINVIEEMDKKSINLGGEQSGHIILSEYSNTGDGILVALKILEIFIKSKKKADKLFNNYNSYFQEKINLSIKNQLENKDKKIIKKIVTKYNSKKSNMRFLVRESGTEPLLRILVEGKQEQIVKKEIQIIKKEIEKVLYDK